MANPDAIAVVESAVALSRSHPHALPLDVLDFVMRGREGQTLMFIETSARNASLADPSTPFGQLVAAAPDKGMDPADWISLTSDHADAGLRSYLLDMWSNEIMGQRFAGRYGVTVTGAP